MENVERFKTSEVETNTGVLFIQRSTLSPADICSFIFKHMYTIYIIKQWQGYIQSVVFRAKCCTAQFLQLPAAKCIMTGLNKSELTDIIEPMFSDVGCVFRKL